MDMVRQRWQRFMDCHVNTFTTISALIMTNSGNVLKIWPNWTLLEYQNCPAFKKKVSNPQSVNWFIENNRSSQRKEPVDSDPLTRTLVNETCWCDSTVNMINALPVQKMRYLHLAVLLKNSTLKGASEVVTDQETHGNFLGELHDHIDILRAYIFNSVDDELEACIFSDYGIHAGFSRYVSYTFNQGVQ